MGLKSFRTALLLGAAALGTGAASAILAPAYAQETTRAYAIKPQELDDALREFGRQTGRDILFAPDAVAGKRAPGVQGQMTERQALEALLAGTGLRFEQTASNGYAVQAPNSPTRLGDVRDAASSDQAEEEIVVVGTNIRGAYPASSPIDIYSAEDIEDTGATTTDQFIGKLPQNLGTRTQFAAGAVSGRNLEGVNGIDLRGLGVGTTLTLLNGRRMALANFGRSADVSLIPLSAVDRVEVLTDGASAIYGSDAIGGVVNFVLRDDFEGAETRLTYGGVTSGHLRQGGVTQTFGAASERGNFLVSYDYQSASALDYSDRDYSTATGTMTPIDRRQSLLATGSLDVTEQLSLSADVLLSTRNVKNDTSHPAFSTIELHRADTETSFANFQAAYEINDDLRTSFTLSYANTDIDSRSHITFTSPPPPFILEQANDTNYEAIDVTAVADGVLFRLPSGPVRFSTGFGRLEEEYLGTTAASGVESGRLLGRVSNYAFAELLLPLASPEQSIPFVNRFEVTLAGRYTSFEDTSEPRVASEFGDGVSPKIGIRWQPFADLNLRATYGESFRAPSLTEVDAAAASNRLDGNILVAGTPSTVLTVRGPSPQLSPETANTYTIGFDYEPEWRPTLNFSATYFNIDYADRVAAGATSGAGPRTNPTNFPDVIFRPVSASEIEALLRSTTNVAISNSPISLADPTAASQTLFGLSEFWIIDLRLRNLSLSRLDGLDVSVRDQFQTTVGDLGVGLQITQIFAYDQQLSPANQLESLVDTVLHPVDLRGRAFATLTRGSFDGSVSINYVDDYSHPYAVGGAQEVDSWTTADLTLAYSFGAERGVGADARISLSVQNLFDTDPAFIASSTGQTVNEPIGFDPANANPLGRIVMLGVSTRW